MLKCKPCRLWVGGWCGVWHGGGGGGDVMMMISLMIMSLGVGSGLDGDGEEVVGVVS